MNVPPFKDPTNTPRRDSGKLQRPRSWRIRGKTIRTMCAEESTWARSAWPGHADSSPRSRGKLRNNFRGSEPVGSGACGDGEGSSEHLRSKKPRDARRLPTPDHGWPAAPRGVLPGENGAGALWPEGLHAWVAERYPAPQRLRSPLSPQRTLSDRQGLGESLPPPSGKL